MFFFSRSKPKLPSVDIHSHLLPGVDDGSKSADDSLAMLWELEKLGTGKVITTPHIHPRYPNTKSSLSSSFDELISASVAKISAQIEYAAEYYIDQHFRKLVSKKEIISFGAERYILVESAFINKPIFFDQVLYDIKSAGFIPVLAHPERYQFLEKNLAWLKSLKDTGVLLQVTYSSFSGYYGTKPKQVAEELLKSDMIDFLATDLHKFKQIDWIKKAISLREVKKLISSDRLLNDELI